MTGRRGWINIAEFTMEGKLMTTVALDNGQWFSLADSLSWRSVTGILYLIGVQWAVRDHADAMLDGPAKLIDAQAALRWLTSAGHDIPEQLTALAEQTRLR